MTIKELNMNKMKNELIELIERDTPKKVVIVTVTNYVNTFCPNCKDELNEYYKRNFCKDCGQRLDWSERKWVDMNVKILTVMSLKKIY